MCLVTVDPSPSVDRERLTLLYQECLYKMDENHIKKFANPNFFIPPTTENIFGKNPAAPLVLSYFLFLLLSFFGHQTDFITQFDPLLEF